MRMNITAKLIALGITASTFIACETQISPTLQQADPVLVVDGWVNNMAADQVIRLTKTQPYFDNENPAGVPGAVVTVVDNNGVVYAFNEGSKPGDYIWSPAAPSHGFGKVGDSYKLNIVLDGETFEAYSYMGRVPVIDSITFDSDKQVGTDKIIYRGEFWATDPAGAGDTYWIKAYKNGILLNKPSEINIAFDAGFSAGGVTDGVSFITPKRRGINANDTDQDDNPVSPLAPGDSVNVEIHSISVAAFNYLNEVITQTDRPGGFQELFSSPIANVSTNINNTNPNGLKAVGFFNVSAVSSLGNKFDLP
jgi:hypothetical protein